VLIAAVIGAAAPGTARADYVAHELYTVAAPAGFGAEVGNRSRALNRQVVGGYFDNSGPPTPAALILRASMWRSNGTFVDLNPAGFTDSYVTGADGAQQVGYGEGHALLWTGSAGSAVDLNPAGVGTSAAQGVRNGQQVGYGFVPNTNTGSEHALLWNGTAGSAVDLHPTSLGATRSFAAGTDGSRQAGNYLSAGHGAHAVLWTGSAASAVDLNPAGFDASWALAAGGSQQVGYGNTGGIQHALLWRGSAGSFVDLNPSTFNVSEALDTDGIVQVGRGRGPATPGGGYHAVVWNGTKESMIDLHELLSPGFDDSAAFSVNSSGTIFGLARSAADGEYHVVEWVPVPEPSSAMIVLVAMGLSCARGRRTGSRR
jgi:hypothetical protein